MYFSFCIQYKVKVSQDILGLETFLGHFSIAFALGHSVTANPFPVMTTWISLCSNSHMEIPVMNTGSLQ